jgi:hypothetical protein
VLEESGLQVNDLQINGVAMIDVEPEQGICLFVLSGRDLKGSLSPSEEGGLEWVEINELHRYQYVEDLPMLIQRIQKGGIFSLQYLYDQNGALEIHEGY